MEEKDSPFILVEATTTALKTRGDTDCRETSDTTDGPGVTTASG